ncbi:MAG TPA: sigma-70 family RNA polymerase sigma factor [Planctomicrobium sp.]|nr:sigma-70 family RNA polymerase sigma factor [Planctomicrobium sp.]
MLSREETTTILLSERVSLISFLSSIVRSYHMAEDIFQELCVKCIMREEAFETQEHLLNWSRVTGKNRAIDLLRSRDGKYEGLSHETLEALASEWSDQIDWGQKDRLDSLEHCLKKLSSSKQEILRLRYFEGRTGSDVAEQLGSKLETIYQSLARIHKALGECVRMRLEAIGRDSGAIT